MEEVGLVTARKVKIKRDRNGDTEVKEKNR